MTLIAVNIMEWRKLVEEISMNGKRWQGSLKKNRPFQLSSRKLARSFAISRRHLKEEEKEESYIHLAL